MPGLALASHGRLTDAIAALRWRERGIRDNRARAFVVSLRAVVDGGYVCYPAFAADPWFEPIRELAEFRAIVETARARHEEAKEAYRAAGGDAVLR